MSLPLEDENKIISRMDHKGKRNVIDIYAAEDGERPFITFKYHISGREEDYPGAVSNTLTYILMSETTMKLNMEASEENKNTPINLAQNTYWNLPGNDSWNILDHMIQIWGPHITLDPHTDHARSLREKDLLSLSPQEMDRRVYRREKDGLKHATKLKDCASEQVVLHGCGLGN
ncbi:hypothetical protein HID58_066342 [Brassica napus]|uniref:Uncharacterized protein n=1 Tax=Brassica napus TaxID=3708 RepID=A0ABQ7ZFU5_BRANA|nr:hypothetical protein HID58_066342 [Brassica napus]